MKALFNLAIVTLLLLIVFGFSQRKGDKLNQNQIDQIRTEVTAVFDSINAIYERKDPNSTLQFYSSDFVAYATNGQKFDLKGVMDQYSRDMKHYLHISGQHTK